MSDDNITLKKLLPKCSQMNKSRLPINLIINLVKIYSKLAYKKKLLQITIK